MSGKVWFCPVCKVSVTNYDSYTAIRDDAGEMIVKYHLECCNNSIMIPTIDELLIPLTAKERLKLILLIDAKISEMQSINSIVVEMKFEEKEAIQKRNLEELEKYKAIKIKMLAFRSNIISSI